jgi:hypothetical protein
MEFVVDDVSFVLNVKANNNSYTLSARLKDTNILYAITWYGEIEGFAPGVLYNHIRDTLISKDSSTIKAEFTDVTCISLRVHINVLNSNKTITFVTACDVIWQVSLVKSIVDNYTIHAKLRAIETQLAHLTQLLTN